ncbi:MAG: TonB family protein [Acidobacteria bacterium]|nr:TonB family protein [Acidobacteriota bacterium]
MFNNLVESDLHKRETARRSWFFLSTLAAYALFLMIAGVASIYAYDAHLEEQTNEYIVTFVPPIESVSPETSRAAQSKATNNADNVRRPSERTTFVDRVTNPNNVPVKPSATASTVPELPDGDVMLSDRNLNAISGNMPGGPPGQSNTVGGNEGRSVIVDVPDIPPLPRAAPTPPPKVLKVSQVLNGRAISLPKPPYPQLAKTAGVSGVVMVQVLIDESGKVLSAQAVSGHLLLRASAAQAARQARFSPTVLGDQPVKVSGVITYNFAL